MSFKYIHPGLAGVLSIAVQFSNITSASFQLFLELDEVYCVDTESNNLTAGLEAAALIFVWA